MFASSIRSRFCEFKSSLLRAMSHVMNRLRRIPVGSGWQVINLRISGRCALLMILLSIPSLLVCATQTVPGLLFQSPQQHAYYYFALVLSQNPLRWIAFSLAACCSLVALAMPAAIPCRATI